MIEPTQQPFRDFVAAVRYKTTFVTFFVKFRTGFFTTCPKVSLFGLKKDSIGLKTGLGQERGAVLFQVKTEVTPAYAIFFTRTRAYEDLRNRGTTQNLRHHSSENGNANKPVYRYFWMIDPSWKIRDLKVSGFLLSEKKVDQLLLRK